MLLVSCLRPIANYGLIWYIFGVLANGDMYVQSDKSKVLF